MSEYEEFDTQLRAWLSEDEKLALAAAVSAGWADGTPDPDWVSFGGGVEAAGVIATGLQGIMEEPIATHIARHDPTAVLAEITGKRALLDHVARWPHEYVDGDTWFSCSQSVGEWGDGQEPGSGCADEKRAGKPCDCGLDKRRITVLKCVAAGYVERDGFKDAWKIDG